MNDKIYTLVYGSLRKGEYNYKRMGSPKYIKTLKLKGWLLYNLGSYPAAKYTGDKKDVLIVDLLELTDKQSYNIDRMEIGAGYHTRTTIIELQETLQCAKIYEHVDSFSDELLVKHGDWSQYIKEKKYATT